MTGVSDPRGELLDDQADSGEPTRLLADGRGLRINEAEEAALGLPSGAYEVPLILRDATFDSKGNLTYTAKSSGYVGTVPLVNGTRDAGLQVDTALYRFRVLGGSNARIFRLALSNGAPFTLIGNDGGLLETASQLGQIELGSGERLDLLVDFRGLPVGTKVMLQDLNSGWNLLEFAVARQVNVSGSIPTGTLSTITKLTSPVATRDFSFDGMSRINGLVYDMNRIDFRVPIGQTELWRFRTGGNAPHPVHGHGASFQVLSRSGGRGVLYPWERGWKDTVLLQDGETVEVLIRFDGYRGMYVMHCHKLEHEDMGMMARLLPPRKTITREELADLWREIDRTAREISALWPEGVSAVDSVREDRE